MLADMKKASFMRTVISTLCLSLLAGAGIAATAVFHPSFAQPMNEALRLAINGAADPMAPGAPIKASTWSAEPVTSSFAWREGPAPRLAPDFLIDVAPYTRQIESSFDERDPDTMRVEFTFSAPARETGLGLDVSVAPRATFEARSNGGRLRSSGAEVRLGRGLAGLVDTFETPTWDNPAWYFFAATDGQAVTWTPDMAPAPVGADGLRFQEDRVTVGDLQAGVSIEANGMQASLSYVQREVSNGRWNANEDFVGATVTWRR
jgi:hypothetical protein